jgi:hypothetical protein
MSVYLRFCLAGLSVAAVASGCSGTSHSGTRTATNASPPASSPVADTTPRPTGVPPEAARIVANRTFAATAPGAEAPQLYAMGCKGGVLTIITSQVLQLYAELPCDRAVPDSVAAKFIGHPVEIRVVFGQAVNLYLDSSVAGSIQFTIGRIWVKG